MEYIIIGLGDYGHVLVEELSALGHEVIGADLDGERADSIGDKIAIAFVINTTDEQPLSASSPSSADMVIVAIGENLRASIRVVAMLKQKQVQHICVHVIDRVHKAVLEAFGLGKILTPEEDAARSLVQLLGSGTKVETFRTDSKYYVVKFSVPEKFVGCFVSELSLDEKLHSKLIRLRRSNTIKNCSGIPLVERKIVSELPENVKIRPDDVLVCYGKYNDLQKLQEAL